MSKAQFSTKERILDAAETLFAQYGFGGTSLRQVTSQADVNIAAVNYHFGSKENLVNEVFRRRMDEMSAQRLSRLQEAVKAEGGSDLDAILAAFVEPPLAMAQDIWRRLVLAHRRAYAKRRRPRRFLPSNTAGCSISPRISPAAGLSTEELYYSLDFLAPP